MEYLHRKELKSDPIVESTAVTMKSIKELLAEEEARLAQAARNEADKAAASKAEPEAVPQTAPAPQAEVMAEPEMSAQPVLQTPPAVPPAPQAGAEPVEGDEATDDAPRPPLIKRLFGRG